MSEGYGVVIMVFLVGLDMKIVNGDDDGEVHGVYDEKMIMIEIG